ncbi:MAG: hypothetical protein A3F83_00440 [Candidatus Glassbacteria bacterium RIFCSPLOWO2_12_FULL_58_11]|uniref:Zn-dependent metallo-hydrolase RNA specificity domain-containing protein n=1 Tax=Candidatus Glassbacteria bacterium RIFCSPLOWO2_12_FULL_58_11 TaxID=1817867 RepID=A0A1F5YNJ8_9BACT|nr:MAG: hypothetical protein A3F83_00440 [Candidatus Glassbacteria bacterium RIFCSPLOWO2_12_FULL_58_11]
MNHNSNNIEARLWEGYLSPEYARSGRNDFDRLMRNPDVDFHIAHTSGHASIDDPKQLAGSLSPAMVVPVHTSYRDAYSEMIGNVNVLQDGEELVLDD